MQTSPDTQIEHYLRTGEYDQDFRAWPGGNFFDRARHGHAALSEALIEAVLRRTSGARMPESLIERDVTTLARTKVAPMVRGLFQQKEQEPVIDVLARSVVFLMPGNIESVLRKTSWLHMAWDLANLYLASFGAELLGEDAHPLVGLSEGTTCYVSVDYFRSENPFDDFLVHEAAHIFHNCKRETIGLRKIRGREWLLEIDFAKRETFAYACETYSRILELGKSPADRRHLLLELEQTPMPTDERVEAGEYLDVLHEAVTARNGWKRILVRCTVPRPIRCSRSEVE